MIAFPLGGVGAGSISLGGRGQLRDWEIFNKPNKGFSPAYAFPAIWARVGNAKPVTRVLESHILPPYEGQNGLGSDNAPGLSRLESAKFIGEYPLARIDFEDRLLPVRVSLEAFSPFIPHEADESGLPVAVLRYRVTNPGSAKARCFDRLLNRQSDERAQPAARKQHPLRLGHAQPGTAARRFHARRIRSLLSQDSRCPRGRLARLASGPLVELAHAVLGRLLR